MRKISLYLGIALLVLTGCGNVEDPVGEGTSKEKAEDSSPVKIVESEKSLPDSFQELSFQREEVPRFNYLVKMAVDQIAFEEEWKLFNMSEEMPKVDFDKNNVIFLGVEESGSCPYLNEDIVIEWDQEEMAIRLLESTEMCTMDATPRTFVIEVDKESSRDLQTVTLLESNVSTLVPIHEH